MSDDGPNLDEVRRMAADIGLERLTEEHLRQLQRATRAARRCDCSATYAQGSG